MSVCLQGGPGLRRPGDSGLRHEGEDRRKHRTLVLKWAHAFPGLQRNPFGIVIVRYATTHVTITIAEHNASYSGLIGLFNHFIDYVFSNADLDL